MKRKIYGILLAIIISPFFLYAWTYVIRIGHEQPAAGELIVYINSDTQFGEGVAAEVRWGDPYNYRNTRDNGSSLFGSFLSGTANWKVTFNTGVLPTSGTVEYQVMGIGTDNNFYSHSGFNWSIDASLPVELTSFSAKNDNNSVLLYWQTATEVNNYGFEVLHSASGEEWEVLGFVNGNGNSNSAKNYTFTDESPFYGLNSYRLKLIDNDGSYKLSSIVEVNLNIPERFVLEQNYPNPFNPSTAIQFAFEKNTFARLKVYDLLGNEIAELFNGNAEAGRVYKLIFDASNNASGIYYYKLISDKVLSVKKMLLLK